MFKICLVLGMSFIAQTKDLGTKQRWMSALNSRRNEANRENYKCQKCLKVGHFTYELGKIFDKKIKIFSRKIAHFQKSISYVTANAHTCTVIPELKISSEGWREKCQEI